MNAKLLIICLLVTAARKSSCVYQLPENWREAKDPLDTDHYQQILAERFPQYIDFGDEDYEAEDDGKQIIRKHITGGSVASWGQFNHHVLLYMIQSGYFICGASLIRYNWVITAAHCTFQFDKFELYFGIINRGSTAQWMTTVEDMSLIKMHPFYNDANLENDIALIFMMSSSEALLTFPHVALIDLPSLDDKALDVTGLDGTVCGFGKTSDDADSSTVLRFIVRKIISKDDCSRTFELAPGVICIDTTGGHSTCSGDSGGGLTAEIEDGRKVLVGVVSFGAARGCTLGYPTGFSSVVHFIDWISDVLGEDLTTSVALTSDSGGTDENSHELEDTTSTDAAARLDLRWIFVVLVAGAALRVFSK